MQYGRNTSHQKNQNRFRRNRQSSAARHARLNGGAFGRDIADWLQAERELVWRPSIKLEEKDNEFRLLKMSYAR